MDSDKNSSGDSGGPGWRPRGGQPDSPSESRDPRFTTFEQDCLDELELESAEDEASSTGARSDGGSANSKDEFVDTWSSEQSSHRLWLAFQHTASSISSLYRDHLASASGPGSTWYSFQTAAGACTDMYKESQDVLRVSIEEARKEGRKLLVKDLVMWMKKRGRRGRHFRRDELLGFLTGKTPPPSSSSRPPIAAVATGMSSPSAASLNSSTHHHYHTHQLHRKAAAGAILSTHCPSIDSSGANHHHHPHHHLRRSLSASPSFHDANFWMPSDRNSPNTTASTTAATTASTGCHDYNAKHESNAFNNNNSSTNSGLFLEPDLRTFRDALAVQGLSGALSNIRVAGSPHSPHGGGTTPPLHLSSASLGGTSPLRHSGSISADQQRVRSSTPSGRHASGAVSRSGGGSSGVPQEDLHQFISDPLSMSSYSTEGRGCGGISSGASGENADPLVNSTFRKRSSSQSGGGGGGGSPHENYSPNAESPTRKRHRLL